MLVRGKEILYCFHCFREKKITGRDVTPFVLEKVRSLTGGASLRASIFYNMMPLSHSHYIEVVFLYHTTLN